MNQSWPGEPDVLEDSSESAVVEPLPEPEPAEPEPDEPELEPAAERTHTQHAAGDIDIPDDVRVLEGEPGPLRRAIAIVVAKFNGEITTQLLDSALTELDEIGVDRGQVTVVPVPGAFELPLASMALAKTRRYSCVIALGCVIRGETPHFDYVASEAASGLQLAALETGVPIAFGVLTTEDEAQARARVGRGADAVRTGLELADSFARLRAAASAATA